MPDDEIIKEGDEATELTDLVVDRVDGVKGPATGQGWLVVKALDDSGQETAPTAISSDPGARNEHPDAPSASNEHALLSNMDADDRAANEEYEGADDNFEKSKLTSEQRKKLPKSAFAYVDSDGVGHFPIHDAAHVRNALSRIGQGAKFGSDAISKVKAAAKKFGVDVSKADDPDPNTTTDDLLTPGSDQKGFESMTMDEVQTMLAAQFEQQANDIEQRFEKALEAAKVPAPESPPDEPVEKTEKPAEGSPAEDPKPVEVPVTKADEPSTPPTPTTPNTDEGEVFKSMMADAFKAAVAEDGPIGSVVKRLEDRIDVVERTPAGGGPILRNAGALPGNLLVSLRDDASTNETSEMASLRKSMKDEPNAIKKADLARQLQVELFKQFAGG